MKSHHFHLTLLTLVRSLSAAPTPGASGLDVVHTTEHADGLIVDWIPITSQTPDGKIASPPPPPAYEASYFNQSSFQPWSMLQMESAEKGPEGTVPMVRSMGNSAMTKGPPVDPEHMPNVSIEAVGDHWYASSAQNINNIGGSASYSLYKAWTESGSDFSLLQTAVIKYNVPKPGANSQLISQTVEAGWINYPNQVSAPHLFTFFTTDGYASFANYKGGWNREVAGWVQTDSVIFPGVAFAPLSTRGGAQYDIKIQWLLYGGNWWLFVLDRWIGYYPASLFGAGTDAGRSLQVGASTINYYGEIYDSHPQLTRTDMGSGNWPEAGWGQSAYIRNMLVTDMQGNDQKYDGSRGIIVSDTSRYRLVADWAGQSTWGAFMYLGGPGAGGGIDY